MIEPVDFDVDKVHRVIAARADLELGARSAVLLRSIGLLTRSTITGPAAEDPE